MHTYKIVFLTVHINKGYVKWEVLKWPFFIFYTYNKTTSVQQGKPITTKLWNAHASLSLMKIAYEHIFFSNPCTTLFKHYRQNQVNLADIHDPNTPPKTMFVGVG